MIKCPTDRTERKQKEYEWAAIRTFFNVMAGICGMIGLVLSALIYCKVYFGG